jgi:hypothetical protein
MMNVFNAKSMILILILISSTGCGSRFVRPTKLGYVDGPLQIVSITDESRTRLQRIPPTGATLASVLPLPSMNQINGSFTPALGNRRRKLDKPSFETFARDLKGHLYDRYNKKEKSFSSLDPNVIENLKKELDKCNISANGNTVASDKIVSDFISTAQEIIKKNKPDEIRDFSFETFCKNSKFTIQDLDSSQATEPAVPLTVQGPQKFVRIVRRSGDEIVINTHHISSTQLGGILLANGDSVFVEDASSLDVIRSDSEGSFTLLGTSIESKVLPVADNENAHILYLENHFQKEESFNTVMTLVRPLPTGKTRSFILPLPLQPKDELDSDPDPSISIMEMHKLAPGDTVHVGTLELLPIVLGSKIISKRLQLAALKEEYELEQMEAHEKLQRLKAFRQKMQSKREGNALVAPQEWVRSASNRIADGFDSMRDAVGLP